MKKIIVAILSTVSVLGLNFLLFTGSLIHLWTVLIAFMEDGFVGSAITFFLPIVSQFYWFFASIKISNTVLNTYSVLILVYIALWIFFIGTTILSSYLSENAGD